MFIIIPVRKPRIYSSLRQKSISKKNVNIFAKKYIQRKIFFNQKVISLKEKPELKV